MPSSTSLLEADEGESEVPPPLMHAFAGLGLEEVHGTQSQNTDQADESLSLHHHQHPVVSHFSLLGTVLDLKPLPLHRPPSGEEVNSAALPEDEEPEVVAVADTSGTGSSLLAQARRHQHVPSATNGSVIQPGMEPSPADTVLLYNCDERDDTGLGGCAMPTANGVIAMLPPGVYGEPSYEAESALLSRRKSVNTTECVAVPSSEHVAEIVGRQGEWWFFYSFG